MKRGSTFARREPPFAVSQRPPGRNDADPEHRTCLTAQEKMMKTTFTILHTNDIHSNLIGVGPVSEYTPAT